MTVFKIKIKYMNINNMILLNSFINNYHIILINHILKIIICH